MMFSMKCPVSPYKSLSTLSPADAQGLCRLSQIQLGRRLYGMPTLYVMQPFSVNNRAIQTSFLKLDLQKSFPEIRWSGLVLSLSTASLSEYNTDSVPYLTIRYHYITVIDDSLSNSFFPCVSVFLFTQKLIVNC